MSNEKWTRSRLKAIREELSGLYGDATESGHSVLARRLAQAMTAVDCAKASAEVVVRRLYKE